MQLHDPKDKNAAVYKYSKWFLNGMIVLVNPEDSRLRPAILYFVIFPPEDFVQIWEKLSRVIILMQLKLISRDSNQTSIHPLHNH